MKRLQFLVLLLTSLWSLLPTLLQGQVDTAWVRRYNGTGGIYDYSNAIAVDNAGNVCVTGKSFGIGTDFDIATVKYNSIGDTVWVRRYNGTGNSEDGSNAITMDNLGNVYVTGTTYITSSNYDAVTIKYNSTGVVQWVSTFNGAGNAEDQTSAIAVDNSGNVYVAGGTTGVGSNRDYITIKYSPTGNQLWARTYNGAGNDWDWADAIAVDNAGNVYITGTSTGLDASLDCVTIKYNANGDTVWVRQYNAPDNRTDYARTIAVDNSENVYVAGNSQSAATLAYDYITIKYNPNGDTLWVRKYNGIGNGDDYAFKLALDILGNCYVTGTSWGAGTGWDYETVKYSPNGIQQWDARYNSGGSCEDCAYDIKLDNLGNAYVTGRSMGSGTNFDFATIKYSSSGNQEWVIRYDGPGNLDDWASAIALDSANNVYITGRSVGSGTSYDYATIKYVQTPGIQENRSPLSADRFSLEVYLYPNPAKASFTVRIPLSADRSHLKLFDISGKLVKEMTLLRPETKVSLNGINTGVYFLSLETEEKRIIERLIIVK